MAWIIGTLLLKEDYDKDYKSLKDWVKNAKVNQRNYNRIKEDFDKISKYKCRDEEKLSVLEGNFYSRFRSILN
jgi:hypothetical protein